MQLNPTQNQPITRLGDPTKTYYENTHAKNLANKKKLEARTRTPPAWEQEGVGESFPPPFEYDTPAKKAMRKAEGNRVRAERDFKKQAKKEFKLNQQYKSEWGNLDQIEGFTQQDWAKKYNQSSMEKKQAGLNRREMRRQEQIHEKQVAAYEATGASEKVRTMKNPLLATKNTEKAIASNAPEKVVKSATKKPFKKVNSNSPKRNPLLNPAGGGSTPGGSGGNKASNVLASNNAINPVTEGEGLYQAIKKDFGIMGKGVEEAFEGAKMGSMSHLESAGLKMVEELGRGSHGMGALKLGGYALAGGLAVKGAFSLASALNPFSDN